MARRVIDMRVVGKPTVAPAGFVPLPKMWRGREVWQGDAEQRVYAPLSPCPQFCRSRVTNAALTRPDSCCSMASKRLLSTVSW